MPRCLCCAIELPQPGLTCGACLRHPPPQQRSLAALTYAYPWDGLILRLKNHQALQLAPLLGDLLASEVAGPLAEGSLVRPDLLLPVPLADARLRQRGHNQAWELTRRLSRRLRLPALADGLWRVIDTPQQVRSSRQQRLTNLRGAFAVNPAAARALAGRRVALIDDVMTTGATVAEAASTLRRAGVAEVQVWVLARTPRDPFD